MEEKGSQGTLENGNQGIKKKPQSELSASIMPLLSRDDSLLVHVALFPIGWSAKEQYPLIA
jgi:hypothetical protein